jgi:hypothetical protein
VRKILAVAARELRERWLLLPASLTLGFSPFVLPAFGVDRQVMPFVGVMTSIGLVAGAAAVMGSTMLARDAGTGRLGFLFSRPVPWGTIWGGKWLAALVLAVSSGLLAAIPWVIAYPPSSLGPNHGGSWLQALDAPGAVCLVVLIVLVVGLANFVSTAFRSRSSWLTLDLVLLLAAFWAIRRYVAPLWLYGILDLGPWVPVLVTLPLVLGLLAGSMVQVAVGRTDLHRSHRALSLVLWSVVALTLATVAGYWQWVRSAGPDEITGHAVTRDPAGRWAYVEGTGRHGGWYPHGFLIDTTSGRYVTRPYPGQERYFPFALSFSADGRFGVLPHNGFDGRDAELALFDLTGAAPRVTEVALETGPSPNGGAAFAVSPKATSVFVAHESGASLLALPSGRLLATATFGVGWRSQAVRFPSDGTARAWLVPRSDGPGAMRPRAEISVVELSAGGGSKVVAVPIATALDPAAAWGSIVPDATGGRIVTADAGLHLRDGASGTLLATLREDAGRYSVLFLADGRIAVGNGQAMARDAGAAGAVVRVFGRDGAPLGETIVDPQPTGLTVGPEVSPGRVAVLCSRSSLLPPETLIVDVGESRVVGRLPGLRSATRFGAASSIASPDARATGVHFFQDGEGRVLRLDFATGERKVIAGRGAPAGERIRLRP